MSISRREFLLAGSAASTLWLAGCGGGGSADGAPKAGQPVTTPVAACTIPVPNAAPVYDSGADGIHFTTNSGTVFPHATTALHRADFPSYQGCSNPILSGVEGPKQELFFNIVDTQIAGVVRVLRLHLAIPKDPSTTSPSAILQGYKFSVGDPTNPSNCAEVFSGELLMNDLSTGQNWAYQITSGTVEIMDDGFGLYVTAPIKLTGVIASASGSNNSGSGTVQMDGQLEVPVELLAGIIT